MKKSLFLIPLVAWGLASCSSDEPMAGDGNGATDPSGNQFITVSINSVGGTRAADSDFVDGEGDENKVSNVRFYFFTASGQPAAVKRVASTSGGDDTYVSYFDLNKDINLVTPGDDQDNKNVEKIMSATIIINSQANKDKVPYSVVAVLNPYNLGDNNLSLDELNKICADYSKADLIEMDKTTAGKFTKGQFVMSNSIYADDDKNVVEAIPVAGHIKGSVEAAIADPVSIYVERAVAKMKLGVSESMTLVNGHANVYDTKVKYDVDDYAGDAPQYTGNICVKFLGWNVISTPDNSRLMKSIDPQWSLDIFSAGEPWNEPLRHRSYWAINPERVVFNFGNFGQALPGSTGTFATDAYSANKVAFTDANQVVYMPENAAEFGKSGFQKADNTSKVIIAAQLVQDDGVTPITLAQWGFNYYTVGGLKKLFANDIKIYKKSTTADGDVWKKVTPADITFATADAVKEDVSNGGRYKVYPQLVKDEDAEWAYDINGTQTTTYDAANNLLKNTMGEVKIWNSGYTYYYFDIQHLGSTDGIGEFGVVRNHIYDTTINSLGGLGTPVYDPSEKIIPEKPKNDDTMIAAEIRILKWRIVKKGIDLAW